MKTTLSCDAIIERNLSIETLELLTELIEPEDIYTLIHRPGQVLGVLEQRKIHSSFLSHFVKSLKDLFAWSYLVPSAAYISVLPS